MAQSFCDESVLIHVDTEKIMFILLTASYINSCKYQNLLLNLPD